MSEFRLSGEVRARHVGLAASAWMAHLDDFRAPTHETSSDIVVTHPIPDVLAELGLTKRPGVLNSRQMVNYGGITPDGRVISAVVGALFLIGVGLPPISTGRRSGPVK